MLHDVFDIWKKTKDAPALIADTGAVVTYGGLAAEMKSMGNVLVGYADAETASRADAKAASHADAEIYLYADAETDSHAGDHLAFDGKQALSRRSLVFCMCKNEPGAVIGYLGALAADCVPLLLSADLKEAQFASFFETYHPAYIWAPTVWMGEHRTIPQIRTGQGNLVYEAYGYGLWETGSAPYELHPDLALLLATSGSTGDPKLVRLSRKNLVANAKSICEYLKLDATERPITTLPMQYTYGLSIINSHLLAGAAILMTTAGYVQAAFWEFFERERATSFGGVPYTYEILKKIHLFQKKLPSLKSITQAGGKLPVSLQKEVAQWARSQDVRFFVMYGQTEATARMGYLLPELCLEKPGSIGIAIPGGRFWLADENGQEFCGAYEESEGFGSEIGELVYEGENVSLGYAVCAADLRRGDDRHGVLYTGDLARRDADGYYYIVGRKKRFVKIFGVRVSLDACEQTLRAWYPGAELACAGCDDCLNIYMAEEEKTSGGGLEEKISGKKEVQMPWNVADQRLAEYLHLNRKAFHVVLLDRIPKNDAGKILYRELPA